MTRDRPTDPGHDDLHRRAEEIFHEALDLDEASRRELLERRCGGDATLRREVESLLAAQVDIEGFLDAPAVDPEGAPRTVGPYRLVRELGRGGMGTVWLAEQQTPIRRRVALKLIRPGMDTRDIIARFEAERQAMALMDHPGVAKVFDAGATERDQPYFVMEYVDGDSITEYCRRSRLPLRARIELFQQVCGAIQHAHQKTILHRDIKPSNVLVTEVDGRPQVKVIDFGVAKAMGDSLGTETLITQDGGVVGTLEYMSPEQSGFSEHAIDTRADVYSLGVLLYELLVGALPHDAVRIREALSTGGLEALYRDDPPRPAIRYEMLGSHRDDVASDRGTSRDGLFAAVRGELDWITMTALSHDPARRYQSPADLAADLQRHLDGESVTAAPPSRSYRARKFVRRHRAAVATVGVVVCGLILGAAGLAYGLVRAIEAEERATQEARTAGEITEFLVELFRVNEPGESPGEDVSARDLLERGVDEIHASLDDDPLVRGNLLHSMSRAYWGLGIYAKADTLAEMAVDDLMSALPVTDPRVTEARQQWSLSRFYGGDPRGALTLAEEALRTHSEAHSPIDATALSLRNTRAQIYGGMGDHAGARAEYLRLIQRLREGSGEGVAKSLVGAWNNHAGTFFREGNFEGARASLFRSRTVMDSLGVVDEARRAQLTMNIAACSAQLGDFTTGIEQLEAVLPRLESIFGPTHMEVIGARTNLAVFLMFEEDYDRSVEAFEALVPVASETLGASHPRLGSILHNYALTLASAGRPADAIDPATRAIQIRREVFGNDHPDVANTLRVLAAAYRDAERFDEAHATFDETLALREQLVGAKSPDYASDLDDYALLLEKIEGPDVAIAALTRGLDIRRAAFGEDHRELIVSHKVLGEVNGRAERFEVAIEHLERALELRETAVGADHPRVAEDLDDLAAILRDAGDQARADEVASRAETIRTSHEQN